MVVLLPQTFQGVQLQSRDLDNFTFTGEKLNRAKGRASTDRTGLAVNGGTQESNRFYFGGIDYRVSRPLLLQYYGAAGGLLHATFRGAQPQSGILAITAP